MSPFEKEENDLKEKLKIVSSFYIKALMETYSDAKLKSLATADYELDRFVKTLIRDELKKQFEDSAPEIISGAKEAIKNNADKIGRALVGQMINKIQGSDY